MRLTLGHIPYLSSRNPAASDAPPATTSHSTFFDFELPLFSQPPAISPRIIVPSVGMKLSVAYPPELNTNGSLRGNRLRNHVSNAQARLLFLFQCAANPVKPYWLSQSGETPTAL